MLVKDKKNKVCLIFAIKKCTNVNNLLNFRFEHLKTGINKRCKDLKKESC